MLKVEQLEAGYDKLKVLHKVNLELNQGEIVSILGANGVGKTTLLRTLSGLTQTTHGKLYFMDEDMTNWSDNKRVKSGLVHVPQDRGIINDLNVVENLELGAFLWRKKRVRLKQKIEEMFELFPRLYERKAHKGGALSGGEQQMLAIARGLMADPKILMLDEPSLGISPIITKEIFKIIRELKEQNIPILLVEQNVRMALNVSDRAYVLSHGKVVSEGKSSELKEDAGIQKMYMGA